MHSGGYYYYYGWLWWPLCLQEQFFCFTICSCSGNQADIWVMMLSNCCRQKHYPSRRSTWRSLFWVYYSMVTTFWLWKFVISVQKSSLWLRRLVKCVYSVTGKYNRVMFGCSLIWFIRICVFSVLLFVFQLSECCCKNDYTPCPEKKRPEFFSI